MTEYDHLYATGLLLLSAMLALGAAPKQIGSSERWDFYRQAWVFGVAIIGLSFLVWHLADRKLDEFGFNSWAGDQPWVTAAVASAWATILTVAVFKIRAGRSRARLARIYEKYEWLMPKTRKELWGSWGAAISAGTSEEIAYRGFLFWYVASLVDPIAALVVTSLLFGIAHGYQRAFGVIFASAAGLILGMVYLLSESLLLAMWMHSTYNVASFTVGRIVLTETAPSGDRRLASAI
jgi:membrane protease YdiL (CAAX protease family)